MNKKVIQKVLKAKHTNFIASIKDEAVRELVDKNSLITGGCIVSMLLNEPVVDYDYYFTNKETVLAVAQYFVKEFCILNPGIEIKPQLVDEGDKVSISIKSAGIVVENNTSEYKYFESQPEGDGESYVNKLLANLEDGVVKEEKSEQEKPKFRPVFLSSNAITLSNQVQLVIRFYGNPEEIHGNYDYVHCTNYWSSEDGIVVLKPQALESILAKQLQYVGSLYPLCSIIRMRKFIKRGWHINAGQILKMCFQLSKLDLSDLVVLEDQLTGVDAAYFVEILEFCKKKQQDEPDFKVTMPYLATIVDKVFY